uniref:Tetratricopeptide repeat protein 39B n=1 Tax=Clastoptera arizonana TaxID=38151 RepID=A0A1B6DVT7_9HEMI
MDRKLTSDETKELEHLMRNIPKWKQKVAGKSLPMEKFYIKKTERYWVQDRQLVLPIFELCFVWNFFKVLGKKWEVAENVYKVIERKQKELESTKFANGAYDADNKALVLLLKGACLFQMNSPLQAEECFHAVVSLEKKIKDDHYLVPYSLVQLANIYSSRGDVQRAITMFEDVKKKYTGYSLESRLHFQIHSALMELSKVK